MRFGEDSDIVSANLVRCVAIRGDSVRADDNALDFALFHHLRCHVITDERHVDAGLHQFPCRQARALQEGTRLIGEDVDVLPCFVCAEHDGQRRAIIGCRQAASVAMRQNRVVFFQQRHAVLADGATHRPIFLNDFLCFSEEPCFERGYFKVAVLRRRAVYSVKCPEQVNGCRARGCQIVGCGLQFRGECIVSRRRGIPSAEHRAERAGDADSGGTPHSQRFNRFPHRCDVIAINLFKFSGQQRLIYHPNSAICPFNS